MKNYTCPHCDTEIDQILEDTKKYYYWFYDKYTSKMSYTEGETSDDNVFVCPNCFNEVDFQDFENHYKKQDDDELTFEQENLIIEQGRDK